MADQVDEFGRVIPNKRTQSSGENKGKERDRDRDRERERSRSRDRDRRISLHRERDSREPTKRDRTPREEQSGSRGERDRAREGGDKSNYREDRDRDRGSRGSQRRESRSRSPPKNSAGTGRIMKSFRTFRRSYEGDDSDANLVRQKYEEYCTQFVMETIDMFFEEHKNEEWFQERYNPLRQRELDIDEQLRSRQESLALLELVKTVPSDVVETSRLEPQYKESSEENSNLNIRHLSGHVGRCITINWIPPMIPKACVRAGLLKAVESQGSAHVVDRVVFATPRLNARRNSKFERTAWLIMQTVDGANEIVEYLKIYKEERSIEAFKLVKDVTGADIPEMMGKFNIHAILHRPKSTLEPLAVMFSDPARMCLDLEKAMRVSAALDEEREIPQQARLANLLDIDSKLNEFHSSLDGISDKLDFAIAYLRRIHHYLYYSGRQCKDESQILITASGVQFRSELLASSSAVTRRSSRQYSDGDNDNSARDNEDIVDDDDNDENENDESGQLDLSSSLSPSAAVTSGQLRKLEFFDARTEENISASKARYLRSQTPASERASGTTDENDADAILLETNKQLLRWSDKYVRIEPGGKGKCEFPCCEKIFQDRNYLEKHIVSRHVDTLKTFFPSPAEPYMKSRYDLEPISEKPLPQVEVESENVRNRNELRPVLAFLPKPQQLQVAPSLDGTGLHIAPSLDGLDLPIAPSLGEGTLEPNFNLRICHKFQVGLCKRGSSCKYAHILNEVPVSEPPPKVPFVPVVYDQDKPKIQAVTLDFGDDALPPPPKKLKLLVGKKSSTSAISASCLT